MLVEYIYIYILGWKRCPLYDDCLLSLGQLINGVISFKSFIVRSFIDPIYVSKIAQEHAHS